MSRDSKKLEFKRLQAQRSPIRARILELFTQDQDRSLDAADLLADLRQEFNPLSLSQVAYHLRWLLDAELLPGAAHNRA